MSRKLCFFLLICCLHIPSSLGILSGIIKALTDDHPPKGKPVPEVCPLGDVFCRDGLQCIHKTWLCDGSRDCADGSDEDSCRMTCNAMQFQCDQNRCIPLIWRCDGQKDCLDNSDEDPQVCKRSTCPSDHFHCKSGECLPKHWKCDGAKDCRGGDDEDEKMCAKAKECYAGERACKNNKCISNSLWCDGRADCTDGSDEAACANDYQNDAPASCNPGQYRCGSGRCIPERWVCDGWKDCDDNEDETAPECLPSSTTHPPFENFSPRSSGENREMTGGLAHSCTNGDFTCKNGECIPLNWRCDMNSDCEDSSDELGCEKPEAKFLLVTHTNSTLRQSECFHDQFPCLSPAKSRICLPLTQVCDKKMDCLNGTDEGAACDGACKNDNGMCSHKCNPTPAGAVCSCLPGFSLSGDVRSCVDIDECQGASGPCDQKCNNTVGSYECSCAPGFTLEKDRHRCKSIEGAILLFACDQNIRLVSLNSEHEAQIFNGNDRLAVGLDYAQENNSTIIFYSDEERHRLSMVKLMQPQNQERVILDNVQGVAEVAYDWVAKNLYFVDRVRGQIGICSLGGNLAYCTQLLPSRARAIAVHPGHSMLFYAEGRSDGGKIERTFLDGSGRVTVLDKKVLSPTLLTIDFIHDRLYFADTQVNFLESCKLEGSDRRIVFHMKDAQPYGMSIFNGRLYYTDWKSQAVKKVAVNGSQAVTLFSSPRKPMSLTIIHESRQPNFNSACKADKNPCQHICAAKAGNRRTCMCHEGFKLRANGISCDPVAGIVSLFRKDGVDAPRAINFTNGLHHGKRLCNKKDKPTMDEVCICMMGKCFWEPIHEDVKAAIARTGNGEEFGAAHAEPSVHKTSLRTNDLSRYSAATLAGIICACVVSILALLLIVFLLRKYKPHLMDPYSDQKSLIDEVDNAPGAKQMKPRTPSVGASFNNPTYENVSPGSSAYMVKFYKSGYNRISAEGRAAPATPASSAQTV